MSWTQAAAGEKYYDAAEIDEYIEKVTATIKRLQDEVRDQTGRADQAEQQLRDSRSEPPDASRNQLNQLSADAEARSAAILADAQRSADRLVEATRIECERLLETARRTAWEQEHNREVRLLAAVNALVQRSHELRDDLIAIETESADWRLGLATSTVPTRTGNDPPTWQVDDRPPPPPRGTPAVPWLPPAPALAVPRWPAPSQDPLG